jgi:septum formation protein
VVAYASQILEKPMDEQDAIRMLKSLSGSSHMVYTGVTLIAPPSDNSDTPRIVTEVEGTEVLFQTLEDDVIEAYAKTGEPLDKAGAYGYQTTGGLLVKGINGCSWNVIGLPASKLFFMLKEFTAEP